MIFIFAKAQKVTYVNNTRKIASFYGWIFYQSDGILLV